MPIDPSISLAAGQNLSTPPGNAMGQLLPAMMGFAQVQNALNENRLFQQTFAARQVMGEMMASAPSMEAGLQAILTNPQTAAFAGPMINSIRQGELTMTQIQGEQQKQAGTAIQGFLQALPSVYNDPANWNSAVQRGLAGVTGPARDRAAQAIDSIRQSLVGGLPSDPALASQQVKSRIQGMLLSAGVTPDVMSMLTGVVKPQTLTATGPGGAQYTGTIGGGAGNVLTPIPIGGGAQVPGPGLSPAVTAGGTTPGSVAPSGATLVGPDMMTGKYLTDRATDMAQYQKALDTNVSMGGTIMQTVTEARNAEQNFRPGGLASTYARIAQFAQGLGAKQSLVDSIGNGNLASSQEFNKLMVNTVMGQIREQLSGIGGSRLSQMEFKTFSDNNPNIDTDPRAIDKIFNFWTRLYQRDRLEQSGLNDFLAKGGNISQWPAVWQAEATRRGFIQPTETASGKAIPNNQLNQGGSSKAPSGNLAPATIPAPAGRPPLSQFWSR